MTAAWAWVATGGGGLVALISIVFAAWIADESRGADYAAWHRPVAASVAVFGIGCIIVGAWTAALA